MSERKDGTKRVPETKGPDAPSLGELLGDLAHESGTLVRQEMTLAKTEMTQKVTRAAENIGIVLLGGAIANAGLVVLLLGLAYALSSFVPLWASALFFAGSAIAVGVWLGQRGLEALGRMNPVPQKTVATLQESARWAKEQLP